MAQDRYCRARAPGLSVRVERVTVCRSILLRRRQLWHLPGAFHPIQIGGRFDSRCNRHKQAPRLRVSRGLLVCVEAAELSLRQLTTSADDFHDLVAADGAFANDAPAGVFIREINDRRSDDARSGAAIDDDGQAISKLFTNGIRRSALLCSA